MTRRQADFLLVCLAAWTLAAGLVGGAFLNYQRTAVGVALIASALSVLALSIHVTYRHLYRSRRTIWWLPIVGAGLTNLIAAVIGAAALLTPAPTFRNLGRVPTFLPKPPNNLIGAFAATSKDMTEVYPLDVVLFMEIFNELNAPRKIRGYSLEIRERTGGDWKPTCHVDLRNKLLFFTPFGRFKATLLKIDRMDDKMSEAMPPYGIVTGVSAWVCPTACSPRDTRLLIVDVQGTREYLPASGVKLTNNPHQFLDSPSITFEREEVDLMTAKIMQNEPCRGIER